MTGFVVIEGCEDYEQILALDTSDRMPSGGVLVWAEGKHKRAVFPDRKSARAAINRTYHYAQAFGDNKLPEKQYCKVEPVVPAYS